MSCWCLLVLLSLIRPSFSSRRRRFSIPDADVDSTTSNDVESTNSVEACPVMEFDGFPSGQDHCNGEFKGNGNVWEGDDGVRWYYSEGDWVCDDDADSDLIFAYITRESSGLSLGTQSLAAKYSTASGSDWRSATVQLTCSEEEDPEWYHYLIGILLMLCCCGVVVWAWRRHRSHDLGKEPPSAVAVAVPATAVPVPVASAVPAPAAHVPTTAVPVPVASSV